MPNALDFFLVHNQDTARGFTEFGGWKGKSHSGFLPTCETVVFMLAGDDLTRRFQVIQLFYLDHYLTERRIIKLTHATNGEPFLSAMLMLSTEYLNRLTTGINRKPDYGIEFPAKLITTKLTWDDLVLSPEIMDEVENINTWLKHSDVILVSGGISVGDYDFVQEALKENGVEELFYKVNQKPGKPLWFGRKNDQFVFGLPGNPASALSCFYIYVTPLLKKISGAKDIHLPRVKANSISDYKNTTGKTLFLKGMLYNNIVEILHGQQSSMLHSFATSNALVRIPNEVEFLNKNDEVECIKLNI